MAHFDVHSHRSKGVEARSTSQIRSADVVPATHEKLCYRTHAGPSHSDYVHPTMRQLHGFASSIAFAMSCAARGRENAAADADIRPRVS